MSEICVNAPTRKGVGMSDKALSVGVASAAEWATDVAGGPWGVFWELGSCIVCDRSGCATASTATPLCCGTSVSTASLPCCGASSAASVAVCREQSVMSLAAAPPWVRSSSITTPYSHSLCTLFSNSCNSCPCLVTNSSFVRGCDWPGTKAG